MIRTIDLRGRVLQRDELVALLPRNAADPAAAFAAAGDLISAVRLGGSAALRAPANLLDGVSEY
jgi:hypothetical protein